jgi:hypothetical protein
LTIKEFEDKMKNLDWAYDPSKMRERLNFFLEPGVLDNFHIEEGEEENY